MDDWQESMVDAITRGLNAAVDVAVYKETGTKTGVLTPTQTAPSWFPTVNQPNSGLGVGQAGVQTGAAAGLLPAWLPMVAIIGAVGLIVWKLAK